MHKQCNRCKRTKPITDFYPRPGYNHTMPGHWTSECQDCMRQRSREQQRIREEGISGVDSENALIEQLAQVGIPAVPGADSDAKAWVDVVALKTVWIEVKESKFHKRHGKRSFSFHFSQTQRENGISSHLICLICNYGTHQTFHLFPSTHAAFYDPSGQVKSSVTYRPAATVLTSRMALSRHEMYLAENNWQLIRDVHQKLLKQSS